MKSVGAMLGQLHNLLGTRDLSDWDISFIASCWSRSGEGRITSTLTDKQLEVLERLYRRHFGD
jgi:hypothetical protein